MAISASDTYFHGNVVEHDNSDPSESESVALDNVLDTLSDVENLFESNIQQNIVQKPQETSCSHIDSAPTNNDQPNVSDGESVELDNALLSLDESEISADPQSMAESTQNVDTQIIQKLGMTSFPVQTIEKNEPEVKISCGGESPPANSVYLEKHRSNENANSGLNTESKNVSESTPIYVDTSIEKSFETISFGSTSNEPVLSPSVPSAKAILNEMKVVPPSLLSPSKSLPCQEPPYKKARLQFTLVPSETMVENPPSKVFMEDLNLNLKKAQSGVPAIKSLKGLENSATNIMRTIGKFLGFCDYLQKKYPKCKSAMGPVSEFWTEVSNLYGGIALQLSLTEKEIDKFVAHCKSGEGENVYVLVSSLFAKHGWFDYYSSVTQVVMQDYTSLLTTIVGSATKVAGGESFSFNWSLQEISTPAYDAADAVPEIVTNLKQTIKTCHADNAKNLSYDILIQKVRSYLKELDDALKF